jgi:membrane protein
MLLLRDVQRRYSRRGGRYLAAGLAFLGFVALFPILLVGTAVTTWLFRGDPGIVDGIIDVLGLGSDTAGLVTDLLEQGQASATAATLIGFFGMIWTGMGMAGAVAHLYDVAWGVESRGLLARFIGLGWLAGAGILFVGAVALTGVFINTPWLAAGLGFLAGFAMFVWTSLVLPNRQIHWPSALSGAVVGAIGFQVLTWAGAIVLPFLLESFSSLYGSLGVVFALLTWIYLLSLLFTYVAMVEGTVGKRALGEMTAEVTGLDFPYPS